MARRDSGSSVIRIPEAERIAYREREKLTPGSGYINVPGVGYLTGGQAEEASRAGRYLLGSGSISITIPQIDPPEGGGGDIPGDEPPPDDGNGDPPGPIIPDPGDDDDDGGLVIPPAPQPEPGPVIPEGAIIITPEMQRMFERSQADRLKYLQDFYPHLVAGEVPPKGAIRVPGYGYLIGDDYHAAMTQGGYVIPGQKISLPQSPVNYTRAGVEAPVYERETELCMKELYERAPLRYRQWEIRLQRGNRSNDEILGSLLPGLDIYGINLITFDQRISPTGLFFAVIRAPETDRNWVTDGQSIKVALSPYGVVEVMPTTYHTQDNPVEREFAQDW